MPAPAPDPATAGPAAGPVRHCYVHVPFCPTICPFCSFEVRERRAGEVDRYLAELDRELAALADRGDVGPLDTLYVGGGTPSHLRLAELEAVFDAVERRLGRPAGEVTLEVHPATATPERAAAWVSMGVTRLSVGVESFDDDVLRALGRGHDAAAAGAALHACLGRGATVSLDLIVAVPGHDPRPDLVAAATAGVDHVSAYTLTVEPGTPFARDGVVVAEEDEHAALSAAVEVLGAAGFEHYEVSNHARRGARSEHNQAYWRNRCFAGVGPGAASHLPAHPDHRSPDGALTERHTHPAFAAWLTGERGEPEWRDARDLLDDGLLCGLRLREGVDLVVLAEQCGIDLLAVHGETVDRLEADGLVACDGMRLAATDEGLLVLDRVTAAFL